MGYGHEGSMTKAIKMTFKFQPLFPISSIIMQKKFFSTLSQTD